MYVIGRHSHRRNYWSLGWSKCPSFLANRNRNLQGIHKVRVVPWKSSCMSQRRVGRYSNLCTGWPACLFVDDLAAWTCWTSAPLMGWLSLVTGAESLQQVNREVRPDPSL